MADRAWWLPWLIGVAVIVLGFVLTIRYTGENDDPPSVPEQRAQALPHGEHTVVYTIAGSGKSPEIRFISSGEGDAEQVLGAALPWSKTVTLEVGPTPAVVQLLAGNSGEGAGIECSIRVDGIVVNRQRADGAFSSVSCSAAVNP